MKIVIYVKEERLEDLYKVIVENTFDLKLPDESIYKEKAGLQAEYGKISSDLFTTSNSQPTHFHGWVEVHISYDDYVKIKDRM